MKNKSALQTLKAWVKEDPDKRAFGFNFSKFGYHIYLHTKPTECISGISKTSWKEAFEEAKGKL